MSFFCKEISARECANHRLAHLFQKKVRNDAADRFATARELNLDVFALANESQFIDPLVCRALTNRLELSLRMVFALPKALKRTPTLDRRLLASRDLPLAVDLIGE